MRQWAVSLCALALVGCATQAEDAATLSLNKEVVATQIAEKPIRASPPTRQQWLYGSAEGTVASARIYKAMTTYVVGKAKERPKYSVIADDNFIVMHGENPPFFPCDNKPLAVVFDADETLVWNVGAMRYMAEQGKDFDPAIWNEWEKSGAGKALAMPGAVAALKAIRDAGVTVIANTNRAAANAHGTEDTLRLAGLGELKHGETLFLLGDTPSGSSKDGRREIIASRYCVIAMAGDQLGDFRNLFNNTKLNVKSRTANAMSAPFDRLWGNGWFLFSNPVYGPSVRGGFDEIFTADTKWEPSK